MSSGAVRGGTFVRMQPGTRSRLATAGILLVLVVAGRFLLSQATPPSRDYHPDEGVWLAVSTHAFHQLFVEGDLRYETWSDPRFGEFGTRSPAVGKYVFGLSLFVQGRLAPGGVVPGYAFEQGFDWDAVAERRPPAASLEAARRASAWLAVGCGVLLFLLARELTGSRSIGVCAALVLLLDPLLVRASQRVMMDVPALFFSLLALWAGARLCVGGLDASWRRTAVVTVVTGLACGLALATKMNSLLVLAVILCWVILARPALDARVLGVTAGLLLACGAVFVASNPFLYTSPFANSLHLLELGQLVTGYEVHPALELNDWPARIEALLRVGIVRSGPLAGWLGLPSLAAVLDGGLALLGAGLLLARCFEARRAPASRRGHGFALVYFAVMTAGVLWWTPFVWTRWYLPVEPAWALLEGAALAVVGGGALGLGRRWWAGRTAETAGG